MFDVKKYQKMSRDLQAGMENVQGELEDKFIEGVAGGGALKVTVNGNLKVTKVEVRKDAVDPDDIEMLQDLFRAAANQAIERARDLQQESLNKVTGGIKLPNLPFI